MRANTKRYKQASCGAGVVLAAALLLSGCSKPAERDAGQGDNSVVNALAKEVGEMETDVRIRSLENRVGELELKLATVEAKQQINDLTADKVQIAPPAAPPAEEPSGATEK